jgi:hypothetical protein
LSPGVLSNYIVIAIGGLLILIFILLNEIDIRKVEKIEMVAKLKMAEEDRRYNNRCLLLDILHEGDFECSNLYEGECIASTEDIEKCFGQGKVN